MLKLRIDIRNLFFICTFPIDAFSFSDAENAQHDSPAQNEKIPDASGDKEMANEKQTPDTSKEGTMKANVEGTPSGGMRTKKALFVKKLKKMLEADAKLVTAQASNKRYDCRYL